MLRIAATAFFIIVTPLHALAEKRVALVMGADDYKTIRPLSNAVNDAMAIEKTLEKLGFEVTLESNRDLKRMRRALEDFREDAAGADVALVFFAGHGVEISGQNFLLPTDAKADSADLLKTSAMPLDEIRATIAEVGKVGLIMLDACRNDPFGGGGGGDGTTRAASVAEEPEMPLDIRPGLGRMGNAENVLFAFSAAPGATASDGQGPNSPFTTALSKYLGTDGLEIRSALTLVQQEVYDQSRGNQLPYIENGLPTLFFAATTVEKLPERERLLLAMADVTTDLRDEVERLAKEKDMPLAPLYGALISSDAKDLTLAQRTQRLTDAADAFVTTRNQMRALSSNDPQVTQLRQEAEQQLALGAFDTARGKLAEAAKIDSTSRSALKTNFLERTLSEAATHALSGGASRADLKYDLAIGSYEQAAALYAELGDDPLPADQRAQQLAALETLGDLYLTVGNLAEGRKAYERQYALAQTLAGKEPDTALWQANVAASRLKLGDVLRDQGDSTSALGAYEEGLAIRKALAEANAQDGKALEAEAAAYLQIGALHKLQGDNEKSLQAYEEARGVIGKLVERDPAVDGPKIAMARTFLLMSEVQQATKKLKEAGESAQSGLALAQQLAEAKPDDPRRQFALSTAYIAVGEVSRSFDAPGNKEERDRLAVASYQSSAEILRQLVTVDPKNTAYQRALAGALEGRAFAVRFGNQANIDFDKVLADHNETIAIREALAKSDPTNKLWIGDLTASYANLSTYYAFVPDEQAALDYTKKAHASALQLAALDPRNVDWQRKAWGYYAKISESYIQLKRYDEALKSEQEGLAYVEKLAAANPEQEIYWQDVTVMLDRISRVYWVQKDYKSYWAANDKQLDVALANEKRFPKRPWALKDVYKNYMKVGGSWAKNDPNRALDLYKSARSFAEQAAAIAPDNPEFMSDIANAHVESAYVWEANNDRKSALEAYQIALDLIEKAASRTDDKSVYAATKDHIVARMNGLR